MVEQAMRTLEGADLTLIGAVVGLVEEADRVEAVLRELDPDRLAIGISPGELEGLEAIALGEVEEEIEIDVAEIDEAYAQHLSRFGRVELPPPAYTRAVEVALEEQVPVEALDLAEEPFTETFTDNVGAIDLIRRGRRERRLAKHGVEADDAVEFARKWDEKLLKIGGLRKVEQIREAHMAKRLRTVCEAPERVLAVVDSVRRPGIARRLWPQATG